MRTSQTRIRHICGKFAPRRVVRSRISTSFRVFRVSLVGSDSRLYVQKKEHIERALGNRRNVSDSGVDSAFPAFYDFPLGAASRWNETTVK